MAFINWNNELSVSVKKFDEQHKILIGLINNLHEAMAKGKGSSVTGNILKELVDYTKTHFAEEEKAMDMYVYPGVLSHKIEHKKLADKVINLQARQNSGEMVLSMDIMDFLKDWLTHHIVETDKKYGAFYKAKGIII